MMVNGQWSMVNESLKFEARAFSAIGNRQSAIGNGSRLYEPRFRET
jgi:hypothetical protein